MGFKRKTKTSQEIPTSALPDIIFILLFFFMVTTKMRKENLLVENTRPQVTQLQKLEDKNTVSYIYVGKPKKAEFGTEPKIQVNDAFVSPEEIPQFIQQEKTKLGPKATKLKVVLKVDKEAKMGIITDVKMKLRESDARKIVYSANKLNKVY